MKKNLSRLFATFITSLLLLTSCRSTTMSDFTVTFNGNGGTLISGTEVQKVQNASEIVPPTYERMGYNFDGWNKNINTISVDTTVNAKWLEKSKDTSLSIEGFSQDGSLFSFKVNNDVNIFSYTDKVTISSKSSWKLFSDIEGKIEVVTKTISLSVGDNTNYILVTSENGEYAFYTVVTRRLNMFTVNFDTDGGTIIPSQQVQEESLIQEVANPEKPHYTFSSWDYNFSEPVMRNMTVTASYTINKYEITFKNYDGTTLQKTEWNYNSTPVYFGSTPTRNSTAQYTYTFSGWSPAIVAVTDNQTYMAQFDERRIAIFGSYPQARVTDSVLVDQLNIAAGTLPTSANNQTWTSYKYYISGSNGNNFMWYKDVESGGDKYRGVYFTSYRPYHTTNSSSNSNSYQDDNGYTTGTRYWFKYESITWDVLSGNQTGSALVLADKILDSRDYYHSLSSRTISGSTVYANNYKESDIRTWLNSDFYNQAFSVTEQSSINTSIVDNSAVSTGDASNSYFCANTSDKIFLLSYVEATNTAYGLSTTTSRIRQATDYAKAMGVYVNNGDGSSRWWLRSTIYSGSDLVRGVNYDGDISDSYPNARYTHKGILPALRINL